MVKPKHRQNSIPLEYKEEKKLTVEQRLEWLARLWKSLGIEGTPTVEELETRSKVELECSLMMKKYLGSEN